VQSVLRKEVLARLRRHYVANQRMADELYRHARIAKKLFLEWKNAQRQRESPPHDAYAPGPPRPELRADVIDVAHAERLQLARQPQMKAGEVGENCEFRL